MRLSHLVYTSSRKKTCGPSDIDNILASCKRNNSKSDITGALLYSDQYFIQYLEGELRTILDLYDIIKKDERHENAKMISLGSISERTFPSWQMGTKAFEEDEIEFRTEISEADRLIFKSILRGEQQEGTRALDLVKKFFD